jgi:hypothetical protein
VLASTQGKRQLVTSNTGLKEVQKLFNSLKTAISATITKSTGHFSQTSNQGGNMNCNHNCNQGLNCTCGKQEPTIADILVAGLFGLAIGGVLALTYVYRTGGF